MKFYFFLTFLGFFSSALCVAVGLFDQNVDSSHIHESYAHPQPHHHGQGWRGQSSGSYYHYYPVVGQEAHHQPAKHDHLLWALILLGLSLLLLKLFLPLLLIPLALSLLALLLGGAMMMAMMMMMMMPMMMMPNARTELVGRAFDTVGKFVSGNVSGLVSDYMSSVNFDHCPQRVICEIGSNFLPDIPEEKISSNKRFTSLLMEQLIPKGKGQKAFRRFEKAFWRGSTTRDCSAFSCKPSFKEKTSSSPRSNSEWAMEQQSYNTNNKNNNISEDNNSDQLTFGSNHTSDFVSVNNSDLTS